MYSLSGEIRDDSSTSTSSKRASKSKHASEPGADYAEDSPENGGKSFTLFPA